MTYVGAFAEAVRATAQPCTFLMIVPTTAAVLAARASWQALVAATGAAIVGGWILADNSILLDGAWLRVSAAVVLVSIAVLMMSVLEVSVMVRSAPIRLIGAPWPSAGLVAIVTLVASQWWRPCVGLELGEILTAADGGMAGQLVPMAAYMLGVMVPVAGLVGVRYAIEPGRRLLAAGAGAGALVGGVIAAFLVAGRHDSVVSTLTRWTLG